MKIRMYNSYCHGFYHNTPGDYPKHFGIVMPKKWEETWWQEFHYLLQFASKLNITIKLKRRQNG
jgi:hypothetical protein